MFMSIKSIVAGAASAGLLFVAAALAEPKAPTAPSEKAPADWAPPAEIAPKAAPAASGPSEAAAPGGAADKGKDCHAQAKAKGLHGKARRQFEADCAKQ